MPSHLIGWQLCDVTKQLQHLYIDVILLSETHLKPLEKFFILIYHIHRTGHYPGRNGGISIGARKGIPQSHVYLHPLLSVEATRVCIPIGNTLLAAVYVSRLRLE
jgi:hypothetical protein